ncbi:hypothetical protein N9267_00370 [bacterium]|nr:hypothetical protein [bacterium]
MIPKPADYPRNILTETAALPPAVHCSPPDVDQTQRSQTST